MFNRRYSVSLRVESWEREPVRVAMRRVCDGEEEVWVGVVVGEEGPEDDAEEEEEAVVGMEEL
jgi:hypothetical protein